MRTKQSSSSLRKMSSDDLEQLEINSPGMTFGGMREELKGLLKPIERMAKGEASKTDYEKVKVFGYGWAGYDDLWIPYHKRDYKRCLDVLRSDIYEVRRRTNNARNVWMITTGVKTELRRRGL